MSLRFRPLFRVFVLMACLGWTVDACAGEAYDTVKTADWFTIGGVGIAGTTSPSEKAFRELLKGPEPVARCRALLTEGSPAGQLYGLLGLRLLDRSAFQTALPRYKDSKTVVTTASGCIVMGTTTAEVAGQIAMGTLK